MKKEDLIRALESVARPISMRLQRLFQRSMVIRTVYRDNLQMVQVQLPDGQPSDLLQVFHPFGFVSEAPEGSESIVLNIGGLGNHSIVLQVNDRRYQLKVNKGEMAIHNQFGDKVHIKENREIDIESAVKVNLITPHTYCAGKLEVLGQTILKDTLSVAKAATLSDTLNVAKAVTLSQTLAVTGASTLTGGATISGIQFLAHLHDYTDNGVTMITYSVHV